MTRAASVCLGFVLLSLASLIAACESDLIVLGPTPSDEGVVIFLHSDFRGPSQAINVDVPDLGRTEGPCSSGAEGETPTWSECVSSIRVLPGWSATLYRDDDFKGRSITVTSDAPNLDHLAGPCDGSFNDCIRSLRVTKQ
jgi:hypothetical protein